MRFWTGPICNDDYIWWKVDYNGILGWTVEGANDEYWIEPTVNIPSSLTEETTATTIGAIQQYQGGWLLWFQDTDQVWILIDKNNQWLVYQDPYQQGDFDPPMDPPDGHFQPMLGASSIWREHDIVEDGLGWGLEMAYNFTATRTFYPGSYIVDSKFIYDPGSYTLNNPKGGNFYLDVETMTWELKEN